MALKEELKHQGDFLFRYRSNLPLILIVIGLAVLVYQESIILSEIEGYVYTALKSSAIAVGLLGLLIRMYTVGYTPKNTSGRNTSQGQVADVLNTTGIYSIIRNPLYLGNYFMWVATAMLTGNLWFVLLFSMVFWVYYERIVYAEESFLRNKFGDIYLNWAEKTPIFIPTTLKMKKPAIDFNWKKVIKKEKNGLFALFLLFWIFEVIAIYVKTGSYSLNYSWQFNGVVSTALIYVVIKMLKSNTKIFDENSTSENLEYPSFTSTQSIK